VLRPKKNNIDIQKTSYMIKQITQKEQMLIYQMFFEQNTTIKYNYITMANYINNYKILINDYNQTKNSEFKYLCLLKIYKLLCHTFIQKGIFR